MFSYRHAFHAGNHADVLKHLVLVQLLRHFTLKETPFWVIDTHSGAGLYALDGDWATKRSEFADGIGRLWGRADLPGPVNDYLNEVRALNPDGRLRHYPGSPFITLAHLRDEDRLRLFEMHVNESRVLASNLAASGRAPPRRVRLEAGDGFGALKALLPPPPKRALVLIDPSYEDKHDYARVIMALREGLARFPTGCYAIWYPMVSRPEPADLVRRLRNRPGIRWLHASLAVRHPSRDGFGLHGSGMFVVNPPWTLEASLRESLPWLLSVLRQDDGARFSIETGGR
jgi:23S rRNA (adenine2030-N6)-methyltransferase